MASAPSLARVGAAGPAPAGRPGHRRARRVGGRRRGGSRPPSARRFRRQDHGQLAHRRRTGRGARSDRTTPADERGHRRGHAVGWPALGAGGGGRGARGGRRHAAATRRAPASVATARARARHQHRPTSASRRRSPAPCWWPTAGATGSARTGTTCWSATGAAMGSRRPRPSGRPPTRSSCSTAGPPRSPLTVEAIATVADSVELISRRRPVPDAWPCARLAAPSYPSRWRRADEAHWSVGTVVIVALVAGVALHVAGGQARSPPHRCDRGSPSSSGTTRPGPARRSSRWSDSVAMVAAFWLATAGGAAAAGSAGPTAPRLQRLADSISPRAAPLVGARRRRPVGHGGARRAVDLSSLRQETHRAPP